MAWKKKIKRAYRGAKADTKRAANRATGAAKRVANSAKNKVKKATGATSRMRVKKKITRTANRVAGVTGAKVKNGLRTGMAVGKVAGGGKRSAPSGQTLNRARTAGKTRVGKKAGKVGFTIGKSVAAGRKAMSQAQKRALQRAQAVSAKKRKR